MLSDALQPEIRELIEKKDFATLKEALAGLDVPDVGELADGLDGEDVGVVFRLLPTAKAGEIFGRLELEKQERLLEVLTGEKLKGILNEMAPDDRTELFEDLPEDVTARLLRVLSKDQREVAENLLHYPEDSIGRLMTPEYVDVKANRTVQQVLDHIRQVAPETETLNVLYVVDEKGKLVDELTLEELVLADPADTVGRLIDRHPVALQAEEDREEAVEIFMKHEAVALPVVDAGGVLVGIVTVDDVMDVQEAENTEDFHKMVAVAALEEPYFATTWSEMLRKRLPWLALLFAAELLTVLALIHFGKSVVLFVLIVPFMPLVNATAGNTGSQMAGLIIRGLAVHEMTPDDWWRVLARELALGLTMGLTMGLLGIGASLLLMRYSSIGPEQGRPIYALSVGVSVTVAVLFANIIGSMIPLLLKRIGTDPAVTSGPFLASIMDVAGVLIYFSIASLMLAALGP